MITIVSPTKAGYRLLFFDGRIVTAVGQVTLAETPKGIRPKEYQVRQAGRRQYRNTPTKELVNLLRSTEVMLTARSPRSSPSSPTSRCGRSPSTPAGSACSRTA